MPRFQEGNLERNVELVSKLKDLAKEKNISPAQLALAWLHAQVCLAVALQLFAMALTVATPRCSQGKQQAGPEA